MHQSSDGQMDVPLACNLLIDQHSCSPVSVHLYGCDLVLDSLY